jgi:hypothetical protein
MRPAFPRLRRMMDDDRFDGFQFALESGAALSLGLTSYVGPRDAQSRDYHSCSKNKPGGKDRNILKFPSYSSIGRGEPDLHSHFVANGVSLKGIISQQKQVCSAQAILQLPSPQPPVSLPGLTVSLHLHANPTLCAARRSWARCIRIRYALLNW